MKALLALSLLLFLDSVFSQGNIIPCPTLGSCPKGYYPQYGGPNQLNAECYCKKELRYTPCESSVEICRISVNEDVDCLDVETACSTREIIDACRFLYLNAPNLCDRVNQKLIKEKYAKNQQRCVNAKNDCIRSRSFSCYDVLDQCDPDTTVQLCKDGNIDSKDICEAAEIEQEKDRAGNTKYSCLNAQKFCLSRVRNVCPTIPKLCDVQTVAKWCYKDDTNQAEKISDEECLRVVKKSQDLMFGKSNEECLKQVPLCEGGSPEACMQVPSLCVKEVVSALCNANKMTSKRICTLAGSDKTTTPSHPGCGFFADKCQNREEQYCPLASHYCDDKTIADLCSMLLIEDVSICNRVSGNVGAYSPRRKTSRRKTSTIGLLDRLGL